MKRTSAHAVRADRRTDRVAAQREPPVSVVSDWAISDNMTALGFSPRVSRSPTPRPGRAASTPTLPSGATRSCRATTPASGWST